MNPIPSLADMFRGPAGFGGKAKPGTPIALPKQPVPARQKPVIPVAMPRQPVPGRVSTPVFGRGV